MEKVLPNIFSITAADPERTKSEPCRLHAARIISCRIGLALGCTANSTTV